MLSKVRISGGGRCNVTNACFDVHELLKHYPRGSKELLQVFSQFAPLDTIEWFRQKGVSLKTESDNRMFPVSDSSETIINCFLEQCRKYHIQIQLNNSITKIEKRHQTFIINTSTGNLQADYVVAATGGFPKPEGYRIYTNLGHTIRNPIPSLFTFNLINTSINKILQGVAVQSAEIKLAQTKLKSIGPLLITHWGFSGPAVLKLSAFAAESLHEKNYDSKLFVNWCGDINTEEVVEKLRHTKHSAHKMFPRNTNPFELPKRLWEFLLDTAAINPSLIWAEIPDKSIRKIAEVLSQSEFQMRGKTTFKEEFVTSGGINLKEVDFKTMESKLVKGLYFCGECLNIDGITGGFNFQAAWSTAFVAAKAICA